MSRDHFANIILGCSLLLLGACTPKSATVRNSKSYPPSRSGEQSADSYKGGVSPANSTALEVENEEVVAPTQISGVYLHCLIDDKNLSMQNMGEVNCLLKDSQQTSKAALANLYSAASFAYQRPENSAIAVTAALAPDSSPYHVSFQFTAAAGTSLSRTVLEQFLVMFRATPLQASNGAQFFSAKLGRDGAASNLPEEFPIYYGQGTVINQPAEGFTKRILPTVNRSYSPVDGCYLACYSSKEQGSVYPIGTNVFVMGQFRSKGAYEGRLCRPEGFAPDANLTQDVSLKKLCTQYIPACAGDACWAGNDTGGWYGLN